MTAPIAFPKTRHLALSALEQPEEAKAEGAEAILVPIGATAGLPVAGVRLPEPSQPGAPGVPEPGSLPAAAATEGLAAGAAPVAVPTHPLPWTVMVDVSEPVSDADRCRSIDGARLPVRCASSLEGRQAAGDAAARAAKAGDAVLLAGLDRWYRVENAGFCRSCELSLVEFLRESYGEHFQPFDAL